VVARTTTALLVDLMRADTEPLPSSLWRLRIRQ
jgi:hypothetical protein